MPNNLSMGPARELMLVIVLNGTCFRVILTQNGTVIQTEGLNKSFGSIQAVRNLDK